MGQNKLIPPIILKEGQYAEKEIAALKGKAGIKVIDIYLEQTKELFQVKNPQLKKDRFENEFLKFKNEKVKKKLSGDWIYHTWSNTLLHTLPEKENNVLRTNRNRNIITQDEQEKLRNFTIAIAGLSVGGNIATTLIYNGFPKNIKLADFDNLETTNLNRVRAKLSDIGCPKIDIINRQLYEIDPYINVTNFDKGLTGKNVKDFVSGNPKPKLIFEIIDDFEMKILIRKEAKKYKIPVVMLTSIGDTVLIDVERYDVDPKTKIFNGMVSEEVLEKILSGKMKEEEKSQYAVKIVGLENVPPIVMESIKKIGKSLVGRPQLMSTVIIASGVASFIARKIALGDSILSGRTRIILDDFILKS